MVAIELSLAFIIGTVLAMSIILIVSFVWIVQRKKKLKFHK